MKVIFSHGQESTSFGTKIQQLSKIAEELGFETESIDYREIPNPDLRSEHLINHLKNQDTKNIILVGSSMGGYVSTVTSCNMDIHGLFLLAPALYLKPEEYSLQEYNIGETICEIVHGYDDDIISFKNSVTFGHRGNHSVHLIKGDHRLNSSLEDVCLFFRNFLNRIK